MKFSTGLLAAASLSLLPSAIADAADGDADNKIKDTVALAGITLPEFTPFKLPNAPFFEQFTDDWEQRWKRSNAKKEVKSGEEEWQFVGNWAVEEPTVYPSIRGDKGLVVKDEAAHHAISAMFAKPINNKGKTLVIQYEVKFQDGLECGGGYMKLLKENKELHTQEFSNASPYVIMFGPDKCGSTNKIHFIFKHKHPKTGEYEEKHYEEDVHGNYEKITSLYTLIIEPNQTFKMKIDGKIERNGSLLENFVPSVNPPKEIDDPDDKKPEDWVENALMDDPKASKPEDWDEDEPFEIVDEEAVKPDDWLDDEVAFIPDPDAVKPVDWDDEEDGDWSAPEIANPKCDEASGCGEWTKPMKKNPKYRGKWKAPMVNNPDFKGAWAPRKMTNPDYYEDPTPADFEPIGGIGFELWTMQANIMFDNIYVGHSVADAEALQKATFDIKKPLEDKQEKAVEEEEEQERERRAAEANLPDAATFWESPILFVRETLEAFVAKFKEDPKAAIMEMPQVAGGLAVTAVTVIAMILGSLGFGAASPAVQEGAKKAKEKAAEAKDKAAESVASGVDKAQAELNKRTTRSASSD